MRRILLTAFLLTAAAAVTADSIQWPDSIYPVDSLNGNVKRLEEEAQVIKKGTGSPVYESSYRMVLDFSEDGRLLTEDYYNADGSRGNSIEYIYEDGRLVKKIQRHPGVRNPDHENFYILEDGRVLTAEKIFSTGNYGWKYVNSYDHHGRLVLTSKFDRFWNRLVYSRFFEYDGPGRLISMVCYGMDGGVLWRDNYTYGSGDLLLQSEKRHPDGSLVVRIEYQYNALGLPVRKELYDAAGDLYAVYSYGYETDKKGNWTVLYIGSEERGLSSSYFVPESRFIRKIEYYE